MDKAEDIEIAQSRKVSFGFYLLAAYLFLLYFEPQNFYTFLRPLRLTYVLGITLLVYSFFNYFSKIKAVARKSKVFYLVIILFSLCVFTTYISEYAPIIDRYGTLFKTLVLFLLVLTNVNTIVEFKRICWIIVAFTTLNSIGTIYHYYLGHLPTRMYSYYGSLGQSGSNEYALMMVETLPLVIMLLQLKQTTFKKGFLIVSLLSLAYCLTRTQSRAGMVGLAVITLALIVFNYIDKKHILMIVVFGIVLILKTPASYFDRMSTIFGDKTYEEDVNVTSRIEVYGLALKVINENPIFGVGTNAFQGYVADKYPPREKLFVVHNAYLGLATENGIPAAIIFLAILFFSFRNATKLLKEYSNFLSGDHHFRNLISGLQVAIIGYAFIALTLSAQYNRLFYIIVGLILCAEWILFRNSRNYCLATASNNAQ